MTLYSESYTGTRFYKTDLQIQTPADRPRWRGPEMGDSEEEQIAYAREFVTHCLAVGLDVIGITDHNFASYRFLHRLLDAARTIRSEDGRTLHIFPGFEIEANVGRGCHVLVLFDHNVPLDVIDRVMTQCGIGTPRFRDGAPTASTKNLSEIIEIVQHPDDGAPRGIVICPHAQAEAGIFDNNRISEWLQAHEFTNPDLLCLEVPKPVSEMNENWQALFESGDECLEAWRRDRPIAAIMSSDAKALLQEHAENYIGFRFSWLRMSKPSLEALRQAFLDHKSRIRLTQTNPDASYSHPALLSLTIRNAAFLEDMDVHFSRNLTSIIGGRGTGKSTVLEYIRFLLGKDKDIFGTDPKRQYTDILNTISDSTTLTAELEIDGRKISVSSSGHTVTLVVDGEQIHDIARFFPIRILSQREIYAISTSQSQRRGLIDELVLSDLESFRNSARKIINSITLIDTEIETLPEIEQELRSLTADLTRLRLKLERLDEYQEPFQRKEALEQKAKSLKDHRNIIGHRLRNILTELTEIRRAKADGVDDMDAEEWPKLYLESMNQESDQLASTIIGNIKTYYQKLNREYRNDAAQVWWSLLDAEEEEFKKAIAKLEEDGVEVTELASYREESRTIAQKIQELRQRHEDLTQKLLAKEGKWVDINTGIGGLIQELHEVWSSETEVRKQAANALSTRVPQTQAGTPFIKVEVNQYGDLPAFQEYMRGRIEDRRRISEPEWDLLAAAAFQFAKIRGVNPPEIVNYWSQCLSIGKLPNGFPWPMGDRKTEVFEEWMTLPVLNTLRLWRCPDRVLVTLYRDDGSEVGEIESAGLSVGQRCTAVLAILLARDTVPIFIDQPEEDLDNEFVFHQLVPFLRQLKEQRQIITVTHNANIPVNADAEMVVSLSTRNGKGCLKEYSGESACGGLDREKVVVAVQDIMEGSERAFNQRREKYGF